MTFTAGGPKVPPALLDRESTGRVWLHLGNFDAFARYWESLPDERRVLLDRYQRKDLAIKVVGVGSVGTFCAVVLMMADVDDPLFLQVKQAGTSVLEPTRVRAFMRTAASGW